MLTISLSKRKLIKTGMYLSLIAFGVIVGMFVILTCVDIAAESSSVPIYRVRTDENKIALTFDVAWGNSDTQLIIDILSEYNVKATFFITGQWADSYHDDVKMYFDNGHEIANHSDSHPHPTKLSINDLICDARDCADKLKSITGIEPPLYRAPYGEYDDSVVSTINGMGYSMIQWDCDSLDWKDLNADEINRRILKNVQSGSILLFHTDKENTHEALPSLIKCLQADGYKFVTVSDLIYNDNYDIDANGEQYKTE